MTFQKHLLGRKTNNKRVGLRFLVSCIEIALVSNEELIIIDAYITANVISAELGKANLTVQGYQGGSKQSTNRFQNIRRNDCQLLILEILLS